MTRITNFGRKRTYLEASHLQNDSEAKQCEQPWDGITRDEGEEITGGDEPRSPPKKKRKRTKPSMRDGNTGVKAAQTVADRAEKEKERAERLAEGGIDESVALSKSAKKKKREKDRKLKLKGMYSFIVVLDSYMLTEHFVELSRSEHRRVQRIDEKRASTTCFACREKGHAAKDCPVTNAASGDKKSKSDNIVGICYRCASFTFLRPFFATLTSRKSCGSTKHTLSRCKKPVNDEDPLPYASCFVCGGKGHLASSCPQNKAKGVYPNGGCCKLCGDTSHLAKDCNLRKKGDRDYCDQLLFPD